MAVVTERRTRGRLCRLALVVASVWSSLLIVAAFVAPMYRGTTTTTGPDGTVVEVDWSWTLVAENGGWAVVVMAVPLVVTLLVALALARLRPAVATAVASLLVTLLFTAAVVALFSVGLYALPVAVLLTIAVATAQTRRQ